MPGVRQRIVEIDHDKKMLLQNSDLIDSLTFKTKHTVLRP